MKIWYVVFNNLLLYKIADGQMFCCEMIQIKYNAPRNTQFSRHITSYNSLCLSCIVITNLWNNDIKHIQVNNRITWFQSHRITLQYITLWSILKHFKHWCTVPCTTWVVATCRPHSASRAREISPSVARSLAAMTARARRLSGSAPLPPVRTWKGRRGEERGQECSVGQRWGEVR